MSKKLLSLSLALCLVFTMLPMTAWAQEEDAPSGFGGEIISFAPLTETEKAVTTGTAVDNLELPKSLTAMVRTVSGSARQSDIVTAPEWEETARDISVTWSSDPIYDKDTEGIYVFTPVTVGYTVIAELPKVTVTVGEFTATAKRMQLLSAPLGGGNLIVNPGGELGTPSGGAIDLSQNSWVGSNRWYAYDGISGITAHSGNYFMACYNPSFSTGLLACYQDISIGEGSQGQTVTLTGWMRSSGGNTVSLTLTQLDQYNMEIGTPVEKSSVSSSWVQETITTTILANTRGLRVTMSGNLTKAGAAALDDLSLTLSEAGTTDPSISINDTTVVEGNSGGTLLVFTITLSSSSSKTITLDYATTNGTAIEGEDYTAKNGTLTFYPGETSKTVSVTVLGDTTHEPDETVLLNLSNPGNATIADNQGIGTIQNDDATVPGVPTIGTATAGNGEATVTFTAPTSNGGATITSYTVTASPGGKTATGANSPITVTGLTNGTAYTFTVTATNAAGTGSASAASNNVTPKSTQTITFANPGAQNFGTSPTLSATSSSGLPVTFTSTTPEVCTITSDGKLTFHTTGSATIEANQAGNAAYLPAASVSRTFTINAVVPGAPTIGTVTAGNGEATVNFTAPASNGGASITSYTVTSNPGGKTATGANSPITVTGLTNGTAYTFTVTATNAAGTGSTSAASNNVTPKSTQTITFTNPGAQNFGTSPTLSATSSSGLPVTFTSTTPGVCTITSDGKLTFHSAGSATIEAHQAGNAAYLPAASVSQTFTVNAVVPEAPTIGTVTAGNGEATVNFTAPASNGGATITGYTVTASPGGKTATGVSSPITVTGLTSGTAYTFTVTAINSAGTGLTSLSSNPVTPSAPPTVLSAAVTSVTATSATLNGTVNANGATTAVNFEYGLSTSYGNSVSAVPSSVTGNSVNPVSYTLTGLAPNTTYHYRVMAVNGNGTTNGSDITFSTLALPRVTVANISICGASGTGGTYKMGDTVTASWNNTATGDNNIGITSVTMDFSQFGGSTAVAATNSGDTWTASYLITDGSMDSTNRNISVNVTSAAGTKTTTGTTNATVDNIAPTVRDMHISLSGGTGTGGTYKIGDTVTVSWNNTSAGDNNSDIISSVMVNFSALGGSTAVTASNSGGIWTATYTINASSNSGPNKNVSVTVTDNAGNTTTTADTTNASVELIETISHLDLTHKLTAPETGATPETIITEDTQYTGTVSWNHSPSKFRGSTVYTATVTLTAKSGYTFIGVIQDVFNHTGATGTTNSLGSGNTMLVTIVFPATANRMLQAIMITGAPDKTVYKFGESFNTSGMIVKATYSDDTEDTSFTAYTVDKTGALTMNDTTVTLTATVDTNITTTQSITINKADGPAVIGVTAVDCTNTRNNDGKLTGVTAAMEYKKSGAASYSAGTGSDITGLMSGTYLVRVKATGTHNAGADSTITVGAYVPAPLTGTVTISGIMKYGQTLTTTYVPGNSTGTLSYQWKRGSANIGTNTNTYTLVEADINQTLTCEITSIQQTGSVTSSPTATISKADGPAVIGVSAMGCTNAGNDDGKLIALTSAMEYKKDGDASYTSGTGSDITGLTCGTYLVRVKATNTHNAGADSTITVAAFIPPYTGNDSSNAPAKTEGKIEKDQKRDENAPTASLNDSTEDLKSKVFSTEEQTKVATGKDAKVILKIEDISASVSEEDKKQIEEKLAAEQQNTTDTALLYIDISLFKKIGDEAETRVTETSGKISISIEVPETMWRTEGGIDRTYRVIRIHNGVAEVLEGTYDPITHLFTFETDRFSTYALTYQDLNLTTVEIDESKANQAVIDQDFSHLLLTARAAGTDQKLSYAKVTGADGYLIYGAKCGQELKLLAEVVGTVTDYKVSNLKPGTYYKYQVKAYRLIKGEKVILMTSKLIHSVTENKTYANPSKITSDTVSVKLAVGESKTMNCKVVLPKGKKRKEHTAAIRYEASNREIATVNSKGKITAKGKGTCYVYAYAQNGVYKKIKVTVE